MTERISIEIGSKGGYSHVGFQPPLSLEQKGAIRGKDINVDCFSLCEPTGYGEAYDSIDCEDRDAALAVARRAAKGLTRIGAIVTINEDAGVIERGAYLFGGVDDPRVQAF